MVGEYLFHSRMAPTGIRWNVFVLMNDLNMGFASLLPQERRIDSL
jgi:hypothetical protein